MRRLPGQTLITTDYGKYVWYPMLQLIDFVEKGSRKPNHTIDLTTRNNTELRAMIAATKDMLKCLKDVMLVS